MDPIPESTEYDTDPNDSIVKESPHYSKYLHSIRDLNIITDEMMSEIELFSKEETMEIIRSLNCVLMSLLTLLD
jgi:hypothetical protein